MAQKRKAHEAFAGQRSQLSAFAAAKLARQSAASPASPVPASQVDDTNVTAKDVAEEPYDGHHSGRTTPATVPTEDDVVVPRPPKHLNVQLSTFIPSNENVTENNDASFEFTLQENETAVFTGEYEISVASGIITIYGAVLRPNHPRQRVYASTISALPQIQARQANTKVRIDSINSGVLKLGKLSPLFRNVWNADPKAGRSFDFLKASEDDPLKRSVYALEIDRDMDLVLRTLSAKTVAERKPPHIMAVGGKSSGKSTFNRILCNHLHSWTPEKKCYYLDLDPGQPEFGPPGQISLVEVSAPVLGPPFTHPASQRSKHFRLIRCHTIASTTFKEDSDHYRACARDLIRYINGKFPVIVNACGWTSGLGASVLLDLCTDLAVTDVVLLEPVDTSLVQSISELRNDITSHRISRRLPRPSIRTPAETRAMQTMAYFHHRLSFNGTSERFSRRSISRMRPWKATYTGTNPGIAAVVSYNQSPHPNFLAETLNGSLVAICILDPTKATTSTVDDGSDYRNPLQDLSDLSHTPENLPFIPPNSQGINRPVDPSTSHCVGLALIRGIDTETQTLHLLTPMTDVEIDELGEKTVVLVRGGFDSPDWAYLEDLYKREQEGNLDIEEAQRPWVNLRGQVGVEGMVWRLRHPPMAGHARNA